MKKQYFLLFICIFLLFLISCEDLLNQNKMDISGRVIDVNDAGISGILIATEPTTKEVYSDSSGNFTIDKVDKLETGAYRIWANANDYEDEYEYYTEGSSLILRMKRYRVPVADISISSWQVNGTENIEIFGTVTNTDTKDYHYVKVYAYTTLSDDSPFHPIYDFGWATPNTSTANKLVPQEEADWVVTCDYNASASSVACYAVYDTSE